MPRKPVVTIPTDFFETGNVRALCMKKGGEEALIVYLHLLCMAVKQDREGRLMLYGNIPLDDATIARLMYKTEKSIETSMKLLMDFHLISRSNELKAAGAEEVIFEYEHGDAKVKKNLQLLLESAEAGDTIITLEVSRLSRSTKQLCGIIDIIKEKHLRLVIVGSITIDCRNGELDAMSSAFLKMAGVFSELELQMIRSRVRSSMQHAKAQGKKMGRRPTTKDDIPPIFYKHYPAFISGTLNVSELARICGLSRPTVYKYLKLIG